MKREYGWHAISRINLRKVEIMWTEEVIRYPDRIRRFGKKIYAQKKLNGWTLEVVYVKDMYIRVKTVYWR